MSNRERTRDPSLMVNPKSLRVLRLKSDCFHFLRQYGERHYSPIGVFP